MKKLLLLGGSRYQIPVIQAAHALDIHTITCDYLPDNIGHRYSDEYHNVSVVDKEKVLRLAEELKIDGIMSFASDPGVVTAAYVADQLGLPGCPYDSVQILQNKSKFREFLANNGFAVPKAKGYKKLREALAETELFRWPVIVKPVDSAGSKGVTKADDPSDLPRLADLALSYSLSGEFIIEEYIEKMGDSSDTDCFSVEGRMVFTSFCRQLFDPEALNPYTPAAYSWPSSMTAAGQRELSSELQRLLDLLHMGTSIYNIETREGTDGTAYIMEISPRGGGNRLAEMLRYATGEDLIGNAVRAAAGLPVTELHDPVYNGYWAEYILHADRMGTFRELQIDAAFEDRFVVERDLWVRKGDAVRPFSGANEMLGTLVLNFGSQEELDENLSNIKSFVKVLVD
jgi:biotin carboxylase